MANNNETRFLGGNQPQQFQVVNEYLRVQTVTENGGPLVHLGPDQDNMMFSQTQQIQATSFSDAAQLGVQAERTSRANQMLSSLLHSTYPPYSRVMSGMRPQGYGHQSEQFASGTLDPQGHFSPVPDMSMHSRCITQCHSRATVLPSSSVKLEAQQEAYGQMRIPNQNDHQGSRSHNLNLPNRSSANQVIHFQDSEGPNLGSPNPSIPPKGQQIQNSLYDPVFEKHGTYADPFLRAFVESKFFDNDQL